LPSTQPNSESLAFRACNITKPVSGDPVISTPTWR
jgi:hypothetical protein